MNPPHEPSTVVLPDGRTLAFGAWGEASGFPVVFMHGWPGSRLAGRLLAAQAAATGVRLIVPDRPGIGRSDPLPGRSLLAWGADTAALADALGLERFAVLGFSGGAPFALACAFRLRDRLAGVALSGGLGPLHTREGLSALPPHMRWLFPLARHVPGAAQVPARMISLAVRRAPGAMALQALAAASPPDRVLLARKAVFQALREEFAEAFRQGTGAVAHETRLFSRHWGFPLEALPPGIRLYHGAEDRFVPADVSRRLAAQLRSPRLEILPDTGHFWIADRAGRIFDDLLRSAG